MTPEEEVFRKGEKAKEASFTLGNFSTEIKNKALVAMADSIENREEIRSKNALDIKLAEKRGLSKVLIDRLLLNEKRIKAMADGLREIANLPDPVGEVVEEWSRPNGLFIRKVRVPLGVIGMIYESRPNVTADASGLCLKSGNVIILRGGSEAINSNIAIANTLSEAISSVGVPKDAIQLIETTDREAVTSLLRLRNFIDVIIPRGGEGLIKMVVNNSTVPVIETGIGNCHIYVDKDANLKMAEEIVFNAKVQRPGVCNAAEKLLVHESLAKQFLPKIKVRLESADVELRGDEETKKILPGIKRAVEQDWYTEYLDLVIGIKIVRSLEEAISHINKYGSKHSESIVTMNEESAKKFLKEVDASSVYHNVSTRFTDGFEFGLGAEIGISTQKLHARGPMGLRELTSTKLTIFGSGQIRE